MAKPKPLRQSNVSSKEGMSAAAANKKKTHKGCRKEHAAPELPSADACTHPPDAADPVAETPLQSKGRGGAAKSRRRLARGPRSGEILHLNGAATCDTHGVAPQSPPSPLPSAEDHRVVSTHFHDGATQAVLKVTILAAGFVIGARGISARLIGQVTGAVVHSWTERTSSACRPLPPDSPPSPPPVRLFRIEGKRASVQAAVALIQEAVSKYRELCECKRRGKFVQREHLIGGVEFYYHPPPRKTLAPPSAQLPSMRKPSPPMPSPPPPATCAPLSTSLALGSPTLPHAWNNMVSRLPTPARVPNTTPFPPPQGISTQPFLLNWRLQPPSPPPLPETLTAAGSAPPLPPPHFLPNFRPTQPSPTGQLQTGGSSSSCMASIEESLHRVRLENNEPFSAMSSSLQQSKSKMVELIPPPILHQSALHQQQRPQRQQIQQCCSLFSVFGNGGHPLPIAQAATAMVGGGEDSNAAGHDCRSTRGVPLRPNSNGSLQPLQGTAATAFEFTACDFLRESLPVPTFIAAASNRQLRQVAATAPRPSLCILSTPSPAAQEYCLFGQQRCPPTTGPLLMPPPSQFNGDLSQWPPLVRSSQDLHPSSNRAS